MRISIHAPVRGATCIIIHTSIIETNFNPRPREGGDMRLFFVPYHRYTISIHAPVRGATIGRYIQLLLFIFQSTPP